EVVLADVDARRICESGNVGPVVDDELRAVRGRERDEFARGLQQLTRGASLVTVLQKADTGGEELLGTVRGGCLQQRLIQNHIQLGEDQAHGGHFPLVPKRRSMKCVSRRPEANSGSAKILRCRGMEVFMPS